jgi:hypothetical protein
MRDCFAEFIPVYIGARKDGQRLFNSLFILDILCPHLVILNKTFACLWFPYHISSLVPFGVRAMRCQVSGDGVNFILEFCLHAVELFGKHLVAFGDKPKLMLKVL